MLGSGFVLPLLSVNILLQNEYISQDSIRDGIEDGKISFANDKLSYNVEPGINTENFYISLGGAAAITALVLFVPIALTYFIDIRFNQAVIIALVTEIWLVASQFYMIWKVKRKVKSLVEKSMAQS